MLRQTNTVGRTDDLAPSHQGVKRGDQVGVGQTGERTSTPMTRRLPFARICA